MSFEAHRAEMHQRAGLHFAVDVALGHIEVALEILQFEIKFFPVRVRHHKVREQQRKGHQHTGCCKVGKNDAVIRHTAGEHSDDFALLRQFARHPDDREKYDKGTEQVAEIKGEVEVVVQYDFVCRCIALNEVIDVFRHIKYYGHQHKGEDHKHEGAQKLADDIEVESLHGSTALAEAV